MNQNKQFKAVKPDPRVYIFQLIIVCVITAFVSSIFEMLILFILMLGIMFFTNIRNIAKKCCIIYGVLFISGVVFRYINISRILFIISLFTFFALKLFPIYMAYVILVKNVQVDELITALERMHIPRMLIIPLVIFYRYIPTISIEIKYIRESLKMRGINTSFIGIIKNPIKAIENLLIPLLIRSGKIADEISAASLCRGLNMTKKRTCASKVSFDKYDMIYCIGCLIVCILFFISSNYKI